MKRVILFEISVSKEKVCDAKITIPDESAVTQQSRGFLSFEPVAGQEELTRYLQGRLLFLPGLRSLPLSSGVCSCAELIFVLDSYCAGNKIVSYKVADLPPAGELILIPSEGSGFVF